MRDKLPALQFYVGDWRKDPGVQALDYESRGVWLEILCFMHESEERGRLLLNGIAMPTIALARNLGIPEADLKQTLSKIEAYGVASRDDAGVLYCRRMVRDEDLRRKKAEAGRLGGQARSKQTPSKPQAECQAKRGSSVSSSSSTSKRGSFPQGWEPQLNHHARAKEEGVDVRIEAEKFENYAISNSKTYSDWDRAFTNWLIRAGEYKAPAVRATTYDDPARQRL